ncbi:scaffold attachment factor B1-like isoform X2 [Dendronephthya gigantea]|uniref:scaffold attachment factor B1-like isoform X2 n=1 Tax=Dendronephthya gigantea TaxID=151771 RepID=UPI00106A5BE0|nr:scaffold attachment factor B1-like isoform X2 [Dendronephthya gigantea]
MASIGGKKLTQLRVVDLRAELEKRGLDKTGLKGALVERLEKSLLDESADLNESAEKECEGNEKANIAESEATQTPNGNVDGDDEIPDDFSGFIVLDGDDSEAEIDDAEEKQEGHGSEEVDDVLLSEKNEETENETVEQVDVTEEDKPENDLGECSPEYEYQDEPEVVDEGQEDENEEEMVEESNVEPEADVSTTKPSENQLSLSMCVNTDDVQDDLDEDLKEVDYDEAVEDEGMDEEQPVENAHEDVEKMEADENVPDEDDEALAESQEGDQEMTVDTEEKTVEEDDVKVEAESDKEEAVDKEKEEDGTEAQTETKAKETEKKEAKKESKTEEKKDEKKDGKQVKKEEPAKKPAVKKDEKKVEKKPETKDEKKPGEKKSAADAKKTGIDAKKKEMGKSLWVSNLSSMTRAADLKTRFSQYGKVVGAKIVTNSKSPGGQCFGLVTMSTSEEAAKCIQHLHRTEMHGRSITVDRAKGDRLPTAAATTAKKPAAKKVTKPAATKTKDDKAKDEKAKDDKAKDEKAAKSKDKSSEKKAADIKTKSEKSDEKSSVVKSDGKTTAKTGKESDAKGEKGKTDSKTTKASSAKKDGKDDKPSHRRSSPAIKSLEDVRREKRERQVRERRERERRERVRRERERIMRERAMERERERIRQRERERRRVQLLREREERERQERLRLERERMRQRELERERERERQERERLRLIQERQLREDRERLERERERLERERLQRLERERMERQRAEERRGVKRPGDPYAREKSPTRGPGYWPDSKRPATERSGDGREFFSGMSSRDRGARDPPETRPAPSRERRGDPRGDPRGDARGGHSDPRSSHSTRDEVPRDEHRRAERDRPSASRSTRESPRERDSRDRRPSWEHGAESSSDPQKGLSLLLQRAGVSGILGSEVSGRSSLTKPVVPAGSSSSRDRPGESWSERSSAHARPIMSSHSLAPPGNATARAGRPVVSEPARGWPVEKEHDRSRERDRGVATREMSRSAWSASTNPSSAMLPPSMDRSRTVIPPSRSSALPTRIISQHSAPLPMTVPIIDSRRPVPMSGRGDPFRGAPVPTIPRSAMRRY